jgi:hypothetical protein
MSGEKLIWTNAHFKRCKKEGQILKIRLNEKLHLAIWVVRVSMDQH